eukprot:47225-Prorocentrum_minimum.AAC.1
MLAVLPNSRQYCSSSRPAAWRALRRPHLCPIPWIPAASAQDSYITYELRLAGPKGRAVGEGGELDTG